MKKINYAKVKLKNDKRFQRYNEHLHRLFALQEQLIIDEINDKDETIYEEEQKDIDLAFYIAKQMFINGYYDKKKADKNEQKNK